MPDPSLRVVRDRIARSEIATLAVATFGDMVKAVVDLQRGVMVIGGEMHADAEALLLEDGSRQDDLWGINLYPSSPGDGFVEFDSMINIRPRAGNPSRSVVDERLQMEIRALIGRLVSE